MGSSNVSTHTLGRDASVAYRSNYHYPLTLSTCSNKDEMSSSTFVAPFASYMKLGQGFNSYTQETCIEDAVTVSPRTDRSPTSSNVSSLLSGHPISTITRVNTALTSHETPKAGGFIPSSTCEVIPKDVPFSQIVSYSSRYVENMADIMDALNISTAASIKYGAVKGSGSAGFVDEHKVNDSDINYIISCRVTNETSTNPDDMVFNPIKSLEPGRFTEVYGDCFISGFLEGGQFDAIISIKVSGK